MICVSLGHVSPGRCRELLRTIPFAEIRLDLVKWTSEDIRAVFALPRRLIATCRPGRLPDGRRLHILMEALEAGAAFVDIESDTPVRRRRSLLSCAARNKRRLIFSYHNDELTPPLAVLGRLVRRSLSQGADVVKIACRVRSAPDALRIMSLYRGPAGRTGRILAFGTGPRGAWTRIAAPLLGAPFTFARPDGRPGTAPGQVAYGEMKKILGLLSARTP